MKKMAKFISKVMAFLYVYMISALKKIGVVDNNKILIIASGHMGNAVMDIDSIIAIKNIFKQQGKEIYLLCSTTLWKVFNLIEDMSDFRFIGEKYHYSGNGTNFKNVYAIVKTIRNYEFEKVIVTLTNDPVAHYVVASLRCNLSYGVFDKVKHTSGGLRYYFEKFYTNKIMAPIDMHEFQRLKLLVKDLGNTEYKAGIHYIKPAESCSDDRRRPYITIALDSMVTERRWPIEKYIQFGEYVLCNTDYYIYLTGGAMDFEDAAKLENFLKKERVINLIGKTSLSGWIEILRGSCFHLSVDSGSVHFAASVGTPCICLSGVWDGKRCMPYQIDLLTEKTSVPVCVYQEKYIEATQKCYGCKIKTGKFGRANNLCWKDCIEGKPCRCLSNIQVSNVIAAFNEMI